MEMLVQYWVDALSYRAGTPTRNPGSAAVENTKINYNWFTNLRMHSSRMRIVRCSGRLLGGGGVSAWGVVSAHGGLPGGGVCQTPHTPPRTEFLTHACENITFPQLLLRTVTRAIQNWLDNKHDSRNFSLSTDHWPVCSPMYPSLNKVTHCS